MDQVCIHCVRYPSDTRPWCSENPGKGCTYGCGHEYPQEDEDKPKPPRKQDKGRCSKCDLHIRNPASATSDCAHEYLA